MKCSCGDKNCNSIIVWDTDSHILKAVWAYEDKNMGKVSLYYDANSLVQLIKEAKKALIAMIAEYDQEEAE